ncbi:copper-binding protein [Uliginosibacterium gangwonense]|uniref:copper-binding protein n=1 Tax=Uliginosibacterium gangwonense TaxID=392736 RepID=UPI000366998E|nr:copper-binding protein [Uliginosibacterium gangwonense]
MKKALATATIAIIFATPITGFAADSMPGMKHDMGDMSGMKHETATSPMSEGVIKKIDKTAGKLTLTHGPLQNLGMPGMTMVFKVKDAAWLEKLKTGDKIRFVAEDLNGTLTVTSYEPAK